MTGGGPTAPSPAGGPPTTTAAGPVLLRLEALRRPPEKDLPSLFSPFFFFFWLNLWILLILLVKEFGLLASCRHGGEGFMHVM
jgi:hypothetical protein